VDGELDLWGGTLFDPDTHALRTVGEYFRDYTNALSPTVDVVAARAFGEPAAVMYEGSLVTATVKAQVSNAGNIATTGPITVTFYEEGGGGPIGPPQVISQSLQGCGDYSVVSMTWGSLDVGGHAFSVQVEAGDADVNPANNTAEGTLLVATSRFFLPLVLH